MQEEIHINATGNILEVLKQMKTGFESNSKSADSFQKTAAGSLNKITSSLKNINLASLNQNIQNLGQGFEDINRPGLDFNANLSELSALTGTTGTALDQLGSKARASAKEFGGNASASLNTYKTILSRLGPDIAKDQNALSLMEKNVQVLSKTMGGDAVGAVDALTTAMLQYGVDLSNPKTAQEEMARMMDVMANSAQEGAAEVPQIAAALKVAGVAAKQANVTFIETNSALQALAAGGKEGSEAGMALRNVLGKMAGEDIIPKEAAEKLRKLGVNMDIVSNTTLPFTTRLRELKKAQGDATVMAQVFGVENNAAAQILLNSVDAQDQLAKKIDKTGGAQAQANIVMESTAEKLKRMQAGIDGAKISFFEMTGGMTAYLGPATEVLRTMTSLSPIYTGAKSAVKWLTSEKVKAAIVDKASTAAKLVSAAATKVVTAATWLWNTALSANPIGLVIIAVAALAVGVYALSKAFSSDTAAEQLNAEVKSRVIEKTAEQRGELDFLFASLKNAKVGSDEYNKTLEKLEQMQPGIIDKYNLQAGAIKDINAAQREMIANLDAVAKAEALKELAVEAYKESFKKEAKGKTASETYQSLVMGGALSGDDIHKLGVQSSKNDASKYNKMQYEATQTDDYKRAMAGKGGSVSAGAGTIGSNGSDASPVLGTPAGYTPSGKGSSASGGSGTVKSISVKIENLIKGDLIFQQSNISESMAEMKRKVTETMVAAIRDVEVAL